MIGVLPQWLEILLAASAFLTAMGIIYRVVVAPSYRVIKRADEMLPVLTSLTLSMKDTPSAFIILKEIIGQFRTDSGSSLRDVVNRLEKAAEKNHAANDELAANLAVMQKLSEADRRQSERLMALVNVIVGRQAAHREETNSLLVGAEKIASDLDESHARADKVEASNSKPGEAADEAARSPPAKRST